MRAFYSSFQTYGNQSRLLMLSKEARRVSVSNLDWLLYISFNAALVQ